jgi:EAL domain-containing protein (putative c-di-GMP-specific phosphodiesterase class I)
LHAQQCDQGQGYLFSPPVPAEAFRRFIEEDVDAGLSSRVTR